MIAILLASGFGFVQNVSPYAPHEEPPIAYFDVVPQQDVVGRFDMGVVAYHLEGVDRVEYTIHREGFEGDYNKDGTVDGEDISVLFTNWNSKGGQALAHLLAHWGTSTPIPDEVIVRYEDANHMRMNPRTGQEEYWFGLETRLHPDTKITVTAEVFPVEGPSVVLDQDVAVIAGEGNYNSRPQYSGVNLFSNNYKQWPVVERYVSPNGSDETGDGTLKNPYKGINRAVRADLQMPHAEVGGTIVYLLEGDHVTDEVGGWPNNAYKQSDGRFITITPAPGIRSHDAKLVGPGGLLYSQWVHYKNVTVESGHEHMLSAGGKSIKWFDNCSVSGLEEDWWGGNYYKLMQPHGTQYWTDCLQAYQAEGMNGIIMRNVHYDYIQCDAIEMHWMQLGLDLLITNHNANHKEHGTACHTDYIQCNGGFPYIHQNIIFRDVYGNHSCQQQGCHMCPGESEKHNIAWVNVELSNTGGNGVEECNISALIFRWCGPGKNNFFKDCIFNDKPNGSTHYMVSYARFNEDGTPNTEGPWCVGHDGVSPKFINVKFEDCWGDWEKTIPLILGPDAGEPWVFYGPDELTFDPDTRDDYQPNPFGPNDPWFSPITNIMYTQTE